VKEAHRLGLRVVVWTVNEPADIQRMRDWGVDGVISDYPDRALQILRKR
jgi:glycerophosphoryl diester phosphodiesterase